MLEDLEPQYILLVGGGLLGLIFGIVGQSSRFCFRQAVGEIFTKTSDGQLRAWLIATMVAISGTYFLIQTQELDLSETAYMIDSLPVLALIVGGVLFGFGMMLARGCAGRQVVLAATGNLRSLIVTMVIAFSGYMTMRGFFAPVRQSIEESVQLSINSTDLVSAISGFSVMSATAVQTAVIVSAAIVAFLLVIRSLVSGQHIYLAVAGLVIGLLVVAGWALTGIVGYDEFEPQRIESLTFVAPGGNAMQFLMIYTGTTANFGVMLIGGVLVGSFLSAMVRKELRLQSFSEPREMLRYLAGGSMMGVGAVMAIGCSIGQGLSGMSTLAFSSLVSLSAITLGAYMGQRFMAKAPQVDASLQPAE